MKSAPLVSRALFGLAAAGTGLLSAGSASAQTATPFYAFVVNNYTSSSGTAFPVLDSVNFVSTQVNEVFADGYTQSLSLQDNYGDAVGTITAQDAVPTALQTFTTLSNGGYADPTHGVMTSATLTGNMVFPGFPSTSTLMLTVQTDAAGDTTQQNVFTPFTASLFGTAPTGTPIGTFSLMNLGSGQNSTVNIDAASAPTPAPVPEASTTISLGLLLALGLGTLAAARRRAARAS